MKWIRTGIRNDPLAAAQAAHPGCDVQRGRLAVTRCPECGGWFRWYKVYSQRNEWGRRNRLVGSRVCARCGAVTDEVCYA